MKRRRIKKTRPINNNGCAHSIFPWAPTLSSHFQPFEKCLCSFFSRLFLSLASISFRTLCICTAAGLIRFTMDFDAMMPTQKESLRVSFDACLIFDSLETVQFSFHYFLLLFTMQFFFSLALFILPHNILSS